MIDYLHRYSNSGRVGILLNLNSHRLLPCNKDLLLDCTICIGDRGECILDRVRLLFNLVKDLEERANQLPVSPDVSLLLEVLVLLLN